MAALPNPGQKIHNLARRYRWRRPKMLYPQLEAVCALWDKMKDGETIILAQNSQNEGNMSGADKTHYRDCFKRAANRYGLFAGEQYVTWNEGRFLYLEKLKDERGVPGMTQDEIDGIRFRMATRS